MRGDSHEHRELHQDNSRKRLAEELNESGHVHNETELPTQETAALVRRLVEEVITQGHIDSAWGDVVEQVPPPQPGSRAGGVEGRSSRYGSFEDYLSELELNGLVGFARSGRHGAGRL